MTEKTGSIKRKSDLTMDHLLFASAEQKVLRFLINEPTTAFPLRGLSSRLKNVRGLGGPEGLMQILESLEDLGLVEFLDNKRAVRLFDDDSIYVQRLKVLSALCDLEALCEQLKAVSRRGVLFGSRSTGSAHSESDYDLFVVSSSPQDVQNFVSGHPLAKRIEVVIWSPEDFERINDKDAALEKKLERGIMLWNSRW